MNSFRLQTDELVGPCPTGPDQRHLLSVSVLFFQWHHGDRQVLVRRLLRRVRRLRRRSVQLPAITRIPTARTCHSQSNRRMRVVTAAIPRKEPASAHLVSLSSPSMRRPPLADTRRPRVPQLGGLAHPQMSTHNGFWRPRCSRSSLNNVEQGPQHQTREGSARRKQWNPRSWRRGRVAHRCTELLPKQCAGQEYYERQDPDKPGKPLTATDEIESERHRPRQNDRVTQSWHPCRHADSSVH